MAEATTIARPYAQAVFKLAQEANAMQAWNDMLAFAGAVAADAQMKALIGNPNVSPAKLVELITSVCGDKLTAEGTNLIKVLVDNGRLGVLPEIASIFEELKAEAEKTVEAQLISATAVDGEVQNKIAAALEKRLGRKVTLNCSVDESIVGGAIIRAGDYVIDGSVSGELDRLASAMMH